MGLSTYEHPDTFVNYEAVAKLSARELVSAIRQDGPGELADALEAEFSRRTRGAWGASNRERAEAYFLADYYAWSARKGFPAGGNDPRTGRPWEKTPGFLSRAIERAQNIAAARVAYRAARSFRNPLP